MSHSESKTTETAGNAPEIAIHLEGVEVRGIIRIHTAGDIVVEITTPYEGLRTGTHIPYFARGERSFIGKGGENAAKSLLGELYQCGKFLSDNLERLGREWMRVLEEIRRIPDCYSHDDFLRDRRQLRARLRSGEITHKAYDLKLREIRDREWDSFNIRRAPVSAFFETHWPKNLSSASGITEFIEREYLQRVPKDEGRGD